MMEGEYSEDVKIVDFVVDSTGAGHYSTRSSTKAKVKKNKESEDLEDLEDLDDARRK